VTALGSSTATGAVAVDFDVAVPMGDGVRLAADVFRPRARGRYPVVLIRTPYGKQSAAPGMGAFGGLAHDAQRASSITLPVIH
jgi:predicted acyl esterase